ncbi:Gp49 family protein [Stenotrophomonas geniculata]|uniref:Gp49 family protein n=1 Tax=Stenotrophomonas geniculata TaxID=86188 RepID=UPI002E78820F|nr:Gp49 family protein [Stenotrophomonas geniculata]
MNDKTIEQEIQAKGLTAPRVTPGAIEAEIESEWYIIAADGVPHDGFHAPVGAVSPLRQLTFCVLVLRNGFTVTGESACASPENFDAEIGRKIARQNAVAKIWPLLGFRLRDELTSLPDHPGLG